MYTTGTTTHVPAGQETWEKSNPGLQPRSGVNRGNALASCTGASQGMIREVQQESVAAGALEYDGCLCSIAESSGRVAL